MKRSECSAIRQKRQRRCGSHAYSQAKPMGKERDDLVTRRNRRLTYLVNQVGGYDAVRARHHVFEKRRGILVGCCVRKDSPDEAITERFGVSRKALSRAEPVPLEAVSHHGQIVPLEALPDRVKLIRSDIYRRRVS